MAERRGFLTMLGGAGLAMTLPTVLVYDPREYTVSAQGIDIGLLTREIHREIDKRIGKTRHLSGFEHRVGDESEGLALTHQFYGEMWMFPETEIPLRQAMVLPMAECVAQAAKDRRISGFGTLRLPMDMTAQASNSFSSKSALRGVMAYQPPMPRNGFQERMVFRFDMIGGHA